MTNDINNKTPGDVSKALQGLRNEVDGNITAQKKRRKIMIGIFGSLTVVMAVSMSSTASQAKAISIDDVTTLGRVRIQQSLPSGREALQDYLKQEAPYLVSQAYDDMLLGLPMVRAQVAGSLSAQLDEINTEFERTATSFMEEAIQQARINIEAAYPDAPNKPELIVRDAARYFEVRVSQMSNEIYPLYAGVMGRMTGWVDTVMTSDPSQLNASEQRHRELIETTLILVRRLNLGEVELR
jgi:hypothetical protein